MRAPVNVVVKNSCLFQASRTTMASQKHRQVHHLSREAGDPNGWVESITGLTADQPATDLLNNGSASKQKPSAVVRFLCIGKQSLRFCYGP